MDARGRDHNTIAIAEGDEALLRMFEAVISEGAAVAVGRHRLVVTEAISVDEGATKAVMALLGAEAAVHPKPQPV